MAGAIIAVVQYQATGINGAGQGTTRKVGTAMYSEGANTALSLWKQSNHSSATTETPGDTEERQRPREAAFSSLWGAI